jgi:hypothetical protein
VRPPARELSAARPIANLLAAAVKFYAIARKRVMGFDINAPGLYSPKYFSATWMPSSYIFW